MSWLAVACGGALGSVLRHWGIMAFGAPWATMAINILGSFLIGLAWVVLPARGIAAPLVMTGLLGGFTTFSAFSLDSLKLFEAGRLLEGVIYVGGSVLLSLMAVALGVIIARGIA